MSIAALKELARHHGFTAYCLRLQPLGEVWRGMCREMPPPHTGRLCLDPLLEYPDATSLLLLVRAYRPFAIESGLPGYYIASNAGYHAAQAFVAALCALGYSAHRLEVPLAALASIAGIGRVCKNALIDLDGFGTRTVLYTVATNAVEPENEFPSPPAPCGDCAECAAACPASAIDAAYGLDSSKCLRTYMEGDIMPAWAMERLPGLLGCERCMAACPRNKSIQNRVPEENELRAFDLAALLSGELAAARALVGKNMCTRGRLQAQAAVLAALRKRKDLLPLIEQLQRHPIESVHKSAIWSYHFLHKS